MITLRKDVSSFYHPLVTKLRFVTHQTEALLRQRFVCESRGTAPCAPTVTVRSQAELGNFLDSSLQRLIYSDGSNSQTKRYRKDFGTRRPGKVGSGRGRPEPEYARTAVTLDVTAVR